MKLHAVTLAILLSTAACVSQDEQSKQAAKIASEQAEAITRAMCGSSADRAHGLAKLARYVANSGEDTSDLAQNIYDEASDIADNGCPKN